MKNIKSFEEYSIKKSFEMFINKRAFYKKIFKIISILNNIANLDFNNIKHIIKNKEGYNKTCELINELNRILNLLEYNKEIEEIRQYRFFYDIKQHSIDVDKILNLLEDSEVIHYLSIDSRANSIIKEKDDIINLIKNYKEWHKRMIELSLDEPRHKKPKF